MGKFLKGALNENTYVNNDTYQTLTDLKVDEPFEKSITPLWKGSPQDKLKLKLEKAPILFL